jgi:mitochondrial FAD-linked sulfhydryl oxidase
MTAAYPEKPTSAEQFTAISFVKSFAKLYPCSWCGEDFQKYMEREKVRAGSREEFGRWMCEAHNDVNVKLGKKTFDCDKWEERWRTGWKNGRCG